MRDKIARIRSSVFNPVKMLGSALPIKTAFKTHFFARFRRFWGAFFQKLSEDFLGKLGWRFPVREGVKWLAVGWVLGGAMSWGLDPEIEQLIVSIAPEWGSTTGKLQCFERSAGGWKAVTPAWPVLYGKNGLAWGRGVLGTEEPGEHKVERDRRAPAGVFALGTIYTYDRALPPGAKFPFRTITEADAWIDDVQSPDYNRHLVIPDPSQPPPWFEKQKMRHNDFAYRWLIEIRHNSDPPLSGAGSAIFFHIRRGADRPSAGCTTMAEPDLRRLIGWLRAERKPHYALLPRQQYQAKWKSWGLPNLEAVGALLP